MPVSPIITRVIAFARYEAHQAGSSTIEPQHLLLALARVAKPLFGNPDGITRAVRHDFPPYPSYHDDNQLPLGRAALRIFDVAAGKGGDQIGPEHLLDGIMAEGNWKSYLLRQQHT